MSTKVKYTPVIIPAFEQEINKYISEELRKKIYEMEPNNSTARLKVICKKIIAEYPTANLRPQLLQYAIGSDPKFPRCIGSMIERLVREDSSFPKQILSYSGGKKNPLLTKEREQELMALLD